MIHPLWFIINVIWFIIMYIASTTDSFGLYVVGIIYYIVMLMVEKLYDKN
jgi:hypothetical protein